MRLHFLMAFFALSAGSIFAQVEIRVEATRVQYLLFEPVLIKVSLTNTTEHEIVLRTNGKNPWLSFLVTKADGGSIKQDQPGNMEPLLLQAGETKTLPVNITPLYAFRETGQFKARAVVEIDGQELISGNAQFGVGQGQKVWKQVRPWQGSQLMYSLVRFSPSIEESSLYVRVEDEQENVVYVTYPLGPMISYVDPQVSFDANGKLHIVHTQGVRSYRYTRVDAYGKREVSMDYTAASDGSVPTLNTTDDGLVLVAGGSSVTDGPKRDKLSDAQVLVAPKKEISRP
jgi:hypothetical protein